MTFLRISIFYISLQIFNHFPLLIPPPTFPLQCLWYNLVMCQWVHVSPLKLRYTP